MVHRRNTTRFIYFVCCDVYDSGMLIPTMAAPPLRTCRWWICCNNTWNHWRASTVSLFFPFRLLDRELAHAVRVGEHPPLESERHRYCLLSLSTTAIRIGAPPPSESELDAQVRFPFFPFCHLDKGSWPTPEISWWVYLFIFLIMLCQLLACLLACMLAFMWACLLACVWACCLLVLLLLFLDISGTFKIRTIMWRPVRSHRNACVFGLSRSSYLNYNCSWNLATCFSLGLMAGIK